ncbi:MAG TPA: hypothetical protein VM307_06205 [Egibacteraceae bacterium]|nr:hypothetical protein [Egibacteraceae bacterium]
MARLLAAVLTSMLLFAAVPAAAQEAGGEAPVEEVTEEPTPVECANPDGLEVITTEGLTTDIATPTFDGSGSEYKEFLVDLGAYSLDATAPVDVSMTWGILLNDYDLAAFSAKSSGLSENYQPFDPAEENVRLDVVRHCEVIEAEAINFLAPIDLDSLELTFAVGTVTEPPAAQ